MSTPNYPPKSEWLSHQQQIRARNDLLRDCAEQLAEIEVTGSKFAIASTDVFVEKAMYHLSKRAERLAFAGTVTSLLALAILLTASIHLYHGMLIFRPIEKLDAYNFTLVAIKTTASGGFIASAVYFLVSLTRAFFQEAMALYHRRHALRFGRLYIHLRAGRIEKLSDLQDAFKWNESFGSSFKDINPDQLPKNTLAALLAMPPEVAKELLAAFAKVKGTPSKKKSKSTNSDGLHETPRNG